MAPLSTRQSLAQLTPEALAAFRDAIRGVMARNDNRGYQFYAGWHGVPLGICQHHNEWFLPWHRAYLYHFELALKDIDPTVALPWWDWMTESGIPPAFDVATEPDGRPNVLLKAAILPNLQTPPDWPKETHREPGVVPEPSAFPPPIGRFPDGQGEMVDTYRWLMDATTFGQFNDRMTAVHDNVHVWVNGEMGDPNWAAFDPLFWAHHTMVDRLWRVWQASVNGVDPPAGDLDHQLTTAKAPSFRVRELLDVTALGYDYAAQAVTVSATVGGPA